MSKIPTADVVEVKHGYWVRQEKMVDGKVQAEAVCSNCGRDVVYQVIDNRWQFENYCPHCGTNMDGGEKR
jgi:ribosomal protein L37AE/L43A